jgi:AraC family transcriptional regulator of adaptative response / DNA-3-methyladenine glycosylase II
MAFLGARATPGVEKVTNGCYARTVRVGEHTGVVRAWHDATTRPNPSVQLEISASLIPVLMPLCARIRHLFDLDAEPAAIETHLRTTRFSALDRRHHGLRVPGAFDGFELALRAILGQQVTVKGATTLSARLASVFGEALVTDDLSLARVAPDAARIAEAPLAMIRDIGLPASRAASVQALAHEVASGALRIAPDADVRRVTAQLTALLASVRGPRTTSPCAHSTGGRVSGGLALRQAAGD